MALILRRPNDPGHIRDRSFKGPQAGNSRLAVAVSKDEGHCIRADDRGAASFEMRSTQGGYCRLARMMPPIPGKPEVGGSLLRTRR